MSGKEQFNRQTQITAVTKKEKSGLYLDLKTQLGTVPTNTTVWLYISGPVGKMCDIKNMNSYASINMQAQGATTGMVKFEWYDEFGPDIIINARHEHDFNVASVSYHLKKWVGVTTKEPVDDAEWYESVASIRLTEDLGIRLAVTNKTDVAIDFTLADYYNLRLIWEETQVNA